MRHLADFSGDWLLERRIEDHRAGESGDFTGTARLAETPDGWIWAEHGQLSMAGRTPVSATRRYRWAEPEPGRIEVSFEDGRPFHRILDTARHDCAPDTYDVTYEFADWPVWQAIWRVRGPRKDYLMSTRHRRPG